MNEDIFEGLGVEITLPTDDDFLKIKETLTRIGVESSKTQTLWQSCHILHKRGRYAILHFKELFLMDGNNSNLSEDDLERRNTIVNLLEEWQLVDIVQSELFYELSKFAPLNKMKIIPFSQKKDWKLEAKYTIGKGK